MSEHDKTPKADNSRRKVQLMMDDAEIEAIDAWQFAHRVPTRAKAIRALIRRALDADTAHAAPSRDEQA
ncbi:hypothetical protein [Aquisalinus flavus]|uniref:Uncharacterized protein n=1 Tax=Aquisalinus flavus TaxID=1526572 RepID=A0A8J2V3K4_9PROT|nr:hypothetical protein [Aquisalinus flavus]MBD0425312.1 hypothetical protein [Aquisalinus flavus]UNE49035.1 hypothetical protein FF099_13735 [Aquisalinus flavus]GGD17073.1 hypothetical protein GCM10011342_27320 [Aquisalinus flavus]